MREALRRLLWLPPSLAVMSLAAFWFYSTVLPHPPAGRTHELPIFFNAAPQNVRDVALEHVHAIASHSPKAAAAERALAELGGAALPHVLPHLDALPPRARVEVALALAPVARRMDVGSEEELVDPTLAVLFWERFWQDRAYDFRPVVVRRLVRRLSERALALRRDDVVQLDTFALQELIAALGRVQDAQDVARVRRLTDLASHVTGKNWRLEQDASLRDAQQLTRRWQDWWREHGAAYIELSSSARLAAMLVQTRYGDWVTRAKADLSRLDDPDSSWVMLWRRAKTTVWLLASGLLGGVCLGASFAGLACCRRRPTRLALGAVGLGLVALPTALLARWFHQQRPVSLLGSAILLALVSAALFAHHVAAKERSYAKFQDAAASTGTRAARLCATALAFAALEAPSLLVIAFALEGVTGLHGLGEHTLSAIRTGDVSWLTTLTLVGLCAIAVVQVCSNLVSSWLGSDTREPQPGEHAL